MSAALFSSWWLEETWLYKYGTRIVVEVLENKIDGTHSPFQSCPQRLFIAVSLAVSWLSSCAWPLIDWIDFKNVEMCILSISPRELPYYPNGCLSKTFMYVRGATATKTFSPRLSPCANNAFSYYRQQFPFYNHGLEGRVALGPLENIHVPRCTLKPSTNSKLMWWFVVLKKKWKSCNL